MLLRTLIFALGLTVSVTAAHAVAERAETLRAINWVENPTNHARRGSKGELGPYQFRAETWRMHTKKPFSYAVVREHADEVAILHYEWIKRGLISAGVDPSPFNIAMAWNSGLGSVLNGRVPTVTYNYAERVQNLVEAQRTQRRHLRQQLAAVETPRVPPQISAAAPASHASVNLSNEPTVRFSLETAGTQFTLPAAIDPFEPVVYTNREPAQRPVTAVALNLEAPVFTLPTAAAPRFALLQ